jgi:hypothetical protein
MIASYYVCILMYTISVKRRSTMKVNIHNQCSDFKLQCLGYFNNGAYWNKDPDWGVDEGDMKNADLMPFRAKFKGALIHVLERKHVKTGNQPEPTDILLFVAWESEGYKKFRAFVHLIECDKWFYWSGVLLEEYYQKCVNQFSTYTGPIEDTWLIPDGTVLMTILELDFTQRDGVLSITISEGTSDDHTKRPEWIDLEK